jgi:hypothetical protein
MPRHTLKLLALLTVFTVAPATAGRHHPCPRQQAAAAAAAAIAARPAPAPKGPTRITLTSRITRADTLSDLRPGTALLMP